MWVSLRTHSWEKGRTQCSCGYNSGTRVPSSVTGQHDVSLCRCLESVTRTPFTSVCLVFFICKMGLMTYPPSRCHRIV